MGPNSSPTKASVHLPTSPSSAVVEEPVAVRDGHVPPERTQPRLELVRLVLMLHDLELAAVLDRPCRDPVRTNLPLPEPLLVPDRERTLQVVHEEDSPAVREPR